MSTIGLALGLLIVAQAIETMVNDGAHVSAGDVLAKIPRETTRTKHITGGLAPRTGSRVGVAEETTRVLTGASISGKVDYPRAATLFNRLTGPASAPKVFHR